MTKLHILCIVRPMTKTSTPKYPGFGARLTGCRKRFFPSVTEAIEVMKAFWGQRERTYFSHESGDRMPPDHILELYAWLFDTTKEYLRYGLSKDLDGEDAASVDDGEAAALAAVNQKSEYFNITSSQRPLARHIVILSASEIRKWISDGGDLAQMSGQGTLPVPADLLASRRSFTYIIPANDLSMAGKGETSFRPGSALVIDPEQPILPGEFVLASLPDLDEPVFRRYEATRPYQPGMPYTLSAMNEAYRPIEVTSPEQCSIIGRAIWYSQRL